MNPSVSVAVITYNQERYVHQALQSIISQKVRFNYEIIVCDDCSTDNTYKIIKEFADQYPSIVKPMKQNINVGASRNLFDAIQRCKGNFIAFLEGDDYWTDFEKLQIQYDYLNLNSDFVAVSHLIEQKDDFGKSYGIFPKIINESYDLNINNFLKLRKFSLTSTMVSRNTLITFDNFEFIYEANRNIADFTICMRILNQGKVMILNRTMAVYRVTYRNSNQSSYNSRNSLFQKFQDHIELLRVNDDFYGHKHNFTVLYLDYSISVLLKLRNFKDVCKFYNVFSCIPLRNRKEMLEKTPYVFYSKVRCKIIDLVEKWRCFFYEN